MKQIALRIAILIALFAAVPMSFAQRGAGPIIQNLRQVDQQALTGAIAEGGLVTVQVVASNVNVQALNNIAIVVDLTNVLRDAFRDANIELITGNQIVVGVNVLSGGQYLISVFDPDAPL
jgi:hypothetical protein